MTRVNGTSSRRYEFGHGVAEIVPDADLTRIVLAGDLDMSTVAQARLIIERACESDPEKVVVDLSAVEFVDSHGLHLLATTHRALTATGCMLVVLPPSEPVRRAFEVTGLDGLFGDP
jgi:anti-anti-sigma factor